MSVRSRTIEYQWHIQGTGFYLAIYFLEEKFMTTMGSRSGGMMDSDREKSKPYNFYNTLAYTLGREDEGVWGEKLDIWGRRFSSPRPAQLDRTLGDDMTVWLCRSTTISTNMSYKTFSIYTHDNYVAMACFLIQFQLVQADCNAVISYLWTLEYKSVLVQHLDITQRACLLYIFFPPSASTTSR